MVSQALKTRADGISEFLTKCLQGCCQSRDTADDDSVIASEAAANGSALPHDSSCAAINQPARSISNVESPRGSSILATKNARPNVPIRPPTPLTSSPAHMSNQPPPWTRSQLEREREAFFDTRVSGNEEMWKALRVVCEEIRKGDITEAQGILDALGITCPNGRVARGRGRNREKGGLYDERGELYDIPSWVLTDPEDIIEDEEKDADEGAADIDDDEEEENVDPALAARRRDEKGKGRAEDPGDIVQVRARLSDRATDITISVGMKQKIADIIGLIQMQIGQRRVRVMYLGKILEERSTLEQCGWKQGNVINALVFEGDERDILSSAATAESKR